MNIAYAEYYNRLSQVFNDTISLVNGVSSPISKEIIDKVELTHKLLLTESPIRVVFIGEFNAGKSTLISALTGEDLQIDADVKTTEIAEYSWNGIILVDTPGVQAEDNDTNHDLIARDATLGADLVFFIVSNELFNQRLADHLNYIIGEAGLSLSKKTFIIVNKIDRETNPDEKLLEEIMKVLGGCQEIPIYFCSAAKFKKASKEQSLFKDRFEKQSRFSELINGINTFVQDAGVNGRLSSPVSVIVECLDQLQAVIIETNEQKSRFELIHRQRRILQNLQKSIAEIRKTWKQKAYSTVVAQANESVEQITEMSTSGDLESLFEAGLKKAEGEINSLCDEMQNEVIVAFTQASNELDEIGNSPLGKQVEMFEIKRADKVDISFDKTRPNDNKFVPKFVKSTSKPLQEALEAASKNAKGIRNIYYTIGKKFGKKFISWEATKVGGKLANIAGKFGKAVPFLAIALDLYTQYSEENIKEKKERYLANLRMALRGAFYDQARVEAETLEKTVIEVFSKPVQESFNKLELEEEKLTMHSKTNQSLLMKISEIHRACAMLHHEIYTGLCKSEFESKPEAAQNSNSILANLNV